MATEKYARLNEEYSKSEVELMTDSIRLIIKRAQRGLLYLPTMPSSAAVCLEDIKELADWHLLDECGVKIGSTEGC